MKSKHRQYGLVGYPLGHSFSKDFFTEKFTAERIDAEYLNFEIADIASLPDIIAGHPMLCGLNITIPHKEHVVALLNETDPTAAAIGAVNVVKIIRSTGGNIKLKGYNTDISGFRESLRPLLRPEHLNGRAIVLGSGGAAKAVVAGLVSIGIKPTMVSRTPQPGMLTYDDLAPEIIAGALIIVNATPLGMYPETDRCPDIDYTSLTASHLCYDVVYNPTTTLFMKRCASCGATVSGGLDMLHRQALDAWRIWNENPDMT